MPIVRKLLFLLLYFPQFLFSQNNDSLKPLRVNSTTRSFTENQFENVDSGEYIQNTLYNFQNYIDRGHLGNIGLPFNNFSLLSTSSDYLGFNYSKNNFENYFFLPQKIKFYNTRTPYTDLMYVTGSKREQAFKMTFSYNVKKNWNITADLYRIRSEGFFLRQNTNHSFIALSSNYKSLNNRYYFLASVIYNNAKNSENGGIADDSVFFASGTIDKKLIDVKLIDAKRTTINRSVFFKQYLNFGTKSTDTATYNVIAPESRLILSSLFENTILKYEDEYPSGGYYPAIYFDSTRTFDSTFIYKIENELSWKRLDNNKHRGFIDLIGVGFSVKHQLVKIEQREKYSISGLSVVHGLVNTTQDKIDTTFNNIIGGAEFYNTYSKNKFWWNLIAKYTFSGYNKDDYYAAITFKKAIRDSLNSLTFKVETKLHEADFIYSRYSSNHFRWNNDFGKAQETRLLVNFLMKKQDFSGGIDFTNYTNVLYFNDSAVSKQFQGAVPVITAYLRKDFVFYNWHLNNKIIYQKVPASAVIRLPEFILEHSLYYENDMFKHALRLQIGVSVFYFSEYYANAYMPATAQFYLQDNKQYGNYPFIDFFVNMKIKTVRIFFKIDHLNNGWMGNNYMLTPGYPINDRAFKLGVSWRFFD